MSPGGVNAWLAPLLRRTYTPRVLADVAAPAGLVSLDDNSRLFARNYRRPVLVTAAAGAGDRLGPARQLGQLADLGRDLVARAANDCLAVGGEPLLFQAHIRLAGAGPDEVRELTAGLSDGCLAADCVFATGRGPAAGDVSELAGFCVGVVERDHIVTGRDIQPGDVILGLIGRGCFVQSVRAVLRHYPVKRRVVRGLAAVAANVADDLRPILPPGQRAVLDRLARLEVGFVLVISPYFAESIARQLAEDGISASVIGRVTAGEP